MKVPPAVERPGLVAPTDSGRLGGILLVLATVSVWGTQFPIAKSAFEHIDPFSMSAARYALPVLILLIVLVLREGTTALHVNEKVRFAALIGLVGMCFSPSLVFGGLWLTRPEIAAIIIATQPAMTAIVLWAIRGVRPPTASLVSTAVAFAGVFTVVTRWDTQLFAAAGEWIGDLMVLTGALCWVFYTIGAQRLASWSILRVTTLTMVPGAFGNLVLALTLMALGIVAAPTSGQWLSASWHLVYLAGFGVLAAMLMWNAGTKRIGPLNAMLFQNLIPVVTFAVRYLQGHRFSAIELVGAALVIGALIANNLALRPHRRPRAKVTRPS